MDENNKINNNCSNIENDNSNILNRFSDSYFDN